MPREWVPSRSPSQMISASISIDLSFLLRPTWFSCLYPYLSAGLVFSPWDWLSSMATGREPQRLPRTEPTFQETPPGFQSWRMVERGGRVGKWQVLTAYGDPGASARICSQKTWTNYMQFIISTHIFCKCIYLHTHFLEYNNLAHSDKAHRSFYVTFS